MENGFPCEPDDETWKSFSQQLSDYLASRQEPYTTTRPIGYDLPTFMEIPSGTKVKFPDKGREVIVFPSGVITEHISHKEGGSFNTELYKKFLDSSPPED